MLNNELLKIYFLVTFRPDGSQRPEMTCFLVVRSRRCFLESLEALGLVLRSGWGRSGRPKFSKFRQNFVIGKSISFGPQSEFLKAVFVRKAGEGPHTARINV